MLAKALADYQLDYFWSVKDGAKNKVTHILVDGDNKNYTTGSMFVGG